MKWLFREKFEISVDKPKSELPKQSYKEKCKKWDTKIASGFGLFAFLALMGFVIYNILYTNTPCNEPDTKMYSNADNEKCTTKEACSITCEDINEEIKTVAEYVNEKLENSECTTINELKIFRTTFNKSKLTYGWLKNIKPEVRKLFIESSNEGLKEISENAFVGHPFVHLYHLRLAETSVQVLRQESFRGLNYISIFEFYNYLSIAPLEIQEGALGDMSTTLETLEISKCALSVDDIINLTGTKAPPLPKLSILSLSNNAIPVVVDRVWFSKAQKIVALHLASSGLEKIDKNAFKGLSALKSLYLSDNVLQTLPEGIFQGFKPNKNRIYLANNYWICNCSLQWLQDYYLQYEYINKEKPPVCYGEEDKKFEEVEFCPSTSTTEPSSTTLSSGSSTTTSSTTSLGPESSSTTVSSGSDPTTTVQPGRPEPPSEYITIKCQDQKLSKFDVKIDVTHSVEVEINNKILKIQFHEREGDPLEVEMTTEENLLDYHLVWFNVDKTEETSCRSPVVNGMLFDDFKRNTTYSFSLIYRDDTQVSPKCTFCIKTEVEWKFRPWIKNKFQIPFIVIIIFVEIFLICLTCFITFLCIRKHPKMISGNKNVIILKSKKNSVEEAIPRNYERPAYWDPYLVQSSQGYLTPKYQRYSKVRYRPPLMRSISEWSVTSGSSNHYNYDDPRHLHAMQMLQPLGQHSNQVIEADVYDYRPPLPPPNPGSKRPSAPTQEELYSSI